MYAFPPSDEEVLSLPTDNELIYSPGKWKYPDGTEGLRITRVYVSSKEIIEFGKQTLFQWQCRG